MEFRHRETKKPVMFISETDLFPHLNHYLIKEKQDLPDVDYTALGIAYGIHESQGKGGVRAWMIAFLDYGTKEFYLWFFASGFPRQKLPKELEIV